LSGESRFLFRMNAAYCGWLLISYRQFNKEYLSDAAISPKRWAICPGTRTG
jgi:hypothetical protein